MKEIDVKSLIMNPMSLIGDEWTLITAGDAARGFNTMTASWGHLGTLWSRPTSVIYVRPQRYTKEFVDREPLYTLSFFPRAFHDKLQYLGTHSGRDEDKVAKMGLTPAFEGGFTYFEEANLVLVCRKLYRMPIVPEGFIDKTVMEAMYPQRDFHDLYVGEIVRAMAEA